MNSSIKLARCIPTGEVVHISTVERGLKCNCECVGCLEKLEAHKGDTNEHTFHHNVNRNCKGAQEDAIHIAAKEIIKRNSKIKIAPTTTFEYNKTLLEEKMSVFSIDALIFNPNKKMVIEIAFTHFSEQNKIDYLRLNKIDAVEIDISKVDRTISLTDLETLIINETVNKTMIYPFEKADEKKAEPQKDNWALFILYFVLGCIGFYFFEKLIKKILSLFK